MLSLDILLVSATFLLSAGITAFMRVYARRADLLDVPNQRSSHQVATPRGGGLSIVVVFLGAVILLYVIGKLPTDVFASLIVGGMLIAGIGFADDHGHIPAQWRFLVQVIAATFVLVVMGGLPEIRLGQRIVDLGLLGDAAAVIFTVWFINLYNFMDGIDGIAAVEAVCITGSALVILPIGDIGFVASLLFVVVATVLGFLVWNWPPARIFMGDVGSGFVGFILAVLVIISTNLDILPIWSWLILAGVFVVDATITLITRMINGEQWYAAHNNHAYQKASRLLKGHRPVTLAVLAINTLWLLPMAWFASVRPEFGWWLTIGAWVPLIALCLFLKAGHREPVA